ncbi:MAG: hypothetical protein Q4G35_03290 [Propionibacteriaceae bacterium]|nr:hypothetical protein [Propionibacteriaceae bacterium]
MFGRPKRQANITLVDNTALTGTLAYSWYWGHYALRNVEEILPHGQIRKLDGYVLIPTRSILIVQVL